MTTSVLAPRNDGSMQLAPEPVIHSYCWDGQIYHRNETASNKNRQYVPSLWGEIKSVETYRLTKDTAKKKAGDVYLKISGQTTKVDRWEFSLPAHKNQWSYRTLLGHMLKLVDLQDREIKMTYKAGTSSSAVFFSIYLDEWQTQEVRGKAIYEGVDALEEAVNTLRCRLGLPPQGDEWMNSLDNSQTESRVIDCDNLPVD